MGKNKKNASKGSRTREMELARKAAFDDMRHEPDRVFPIINGERSSHGRQKRHALTGNLE